MRTRSSIGKGRHTVMAALLLFIAACSPSAEENKRYDSMSAQDMAPMDKEMVMNEQPGTEEYSPIYENGFMDPVNTPLSTFSIDVDNAAYSNVRRFLTENEMLPPKNAVRIEEMINYFDYDYPEPKGEDPFCVVAEVSGCPWNNEHRLVHIGIQGKSMDNNDVKAGNYVFLIDVSGSMDAANKLPLVKRSLNVLLNNLGDKDRIALVTYAGNAGLVLESTKCSNRKKIEKAIDRLEAGGATAGGDGLQLAYNVAKEAYIEGGNNRVILCTDGDFNVGVSSTEELVNMIEEKRKSDIYLTICGFGMNNYKDDKMEGISNAGNGNYFYIDNMQEANKVFGKEMRANMFTIAKDVKVQMEFNPAVVSSYRLIGYEDRVLNKEDFNDDTKDAGELGAGHTVTALYEVVPGSSKGRPKVDPLKYQANNTGSSTGEMMTVKLRYKPIHSEDSKKIEMIVNDHGRTLEQSSDDFRFSAAVAGFGMLLRDSEYKGDLTYADVFKLAKSTDGYNRDKYRVEFLSLVSKAMQLSGKEYE